MHLTLTCHPDTPCNAVRAIEVEIVPATSGRLSLHYGVDVCGQISDLILPARSTPQHTDELWKHTCFEAFVRTEGSENYHEFNFSPSTQWAAYAFDNYRTNMRFVEITAPKIDLHITTAANLLDLNTTIHLPEPAARSIRLALSVVIEESNGTISYWALAHPPGEPDFHHTDSFAYTLLNPEQL